MKTNNTTHNNDLISNEDSHKEITNLIKLLDDSDEFIYNHVKGKLLERGKDAIADLLLATSDETPVLNHRVNDLIEEIYFSETDEKFKELSLRKDNILEEAVFLMANLGYPELDMAKYKNELDEMAEKLNRSIEKMKTNPIIPQNDPLQVINIINNFLFFQQGFKGNSDNFYEAENTYFNDVMDRKKGIPISLSILYLLLSRRLNLPTYGVNLPAHFIIKYIDNNDEFFIDPYNQGIVISKSEAIKFLKRIGVSKEDFENISFLQIAADKEIVRRSLNNLLNVYTKSNDKQKTEQLKKIIAYFE